jgi:hypothetical protein
VATAQGMMQRGEAMSITVASLWDPAARLEAARLMGAGHAIGAFARGVCAIMGDGANPAFVNAVVRAKGEKRRTQPLAGLLEAATLVPLLDAAQIPADLHPIFLDPAEFSARLGSLCFIRLPVTEAAARQLPPLMVSRSAGGTPIIQNWDPAGHPALGALFTAARAHGLAYPAGTSMNRSGQPEIADQEEGQAFAAQAGMPLFLTDPRDKQIARGSYTILGVSPAGVSIVREGNIPGALFGQLLQTTLNRAVEREARFAQPVFPGAVTTGADPHAIRMQVIEYVAG